MGDTVGVVDDGEGLAPVTLAGKQPVAQLELHLAVAVALLLEPLDSGGLRLVESQAVDVQALGICAVHDLAGLSVGGGELAVLALLSASDDLADRQAKGGGEVEVALIVGRDRHDGAGAVAHEDVVRDEDGHLLAVDRVGGVRAGEHTGLLLVFLALQVGLRGDGRAVSGDGLGWAVLAEGPALIGVGVGGLWGAGGVLSCGNEGVDELVLGREHHVRRPEEGVRAGGEDLDRARGGRKRELGAAGTADPVALHGLDLLRPVEELQVLEQAVGVGGDAHHPLLEVLAEDREVAALGATLGGDLLVRQHGAQARAPVDGGVGAVNQAVAVDDLLALGLGLLGPVGVLGLKLRDELGDRAGAALQLRRVARRGLGLRVKPGVVDLEEDPLGPAVELAVGGGDGAALIVAESQAAQLALHVLDIRHGGGARVGAGLDGVLLGGQAEGVVAEGVEHVLAGHALEAGVDIGGDIAQRVADVQPGAGGVGEHVLHEDAVFRQLLPVGGEVADGVGCVEGAVLGPVLLPALLDIRGERGGVAVRGLVGRVSWGVHGWSF